VAKKKGCLAGPTRGGRDSKYVCHESHTVERKGGFGRRAIGNRRKRERGGGNQALAIVCNDGLGVCLLPNREDATPVKPPFGNTKEAAPK